MDLEEIVWEVMGSIHLAQGRNKWRALLKTAMKFPVPQKAMNFLNRRKVIRFSKRTLLDGVMQNNHVISTTFV
jgi:hypothetical protein